MSINKIIHYGLFGGWKFSDLDRKCIESWRSVLPDFELRLWTDTNGPDTPFFRDAIAKKPINASNYVKYWALNRFGGIFLDNDVEVLKPFDLSPNCFLGWQRDDIEQDCINTAVIGSIPEHPFIARCLGRMNRDHADAWPVWFGCGMPTEELRASGMKGLNVEQDVGDVRVYDKDRFYPFRWDEEHDPSRATERTIAIHHWSGSWKQ